MLLTCNGHWAVSSLVVEEVTVSLVFGALHHWCPGVKIIDTSVFHYGQKSDSAIQFFGYHLAN